MTLLQRNRLFKIEICFAALALFMMLVITLAVLYAAPQTAAAAIRRAPGVLQPLLTRFSGPWPYAPLVSMLLANIYALAALILILNFFEKTNSPEIIFFAMFVFSFSFELVRSILLLKDTLLLSQVYLIIASRVLYFGRYFGVFCLFGASVYAAGLDIQKHGNVLMIAVIITLLIVIGMPIDSLAWNSSLTMLSGYESMFLLAQAGIALITLLSFFVSAYTQRSKEHFIIACGMILTLLGRNILFAADTIAALPLGIVILGLGTWLACNQLHHVYLWL
ncbi:MAG: hypothetical protein LBK64_05190 [Spirochaetaceae bacterium]|jgi:hypothetical protein|nr:hypothetical protein [Spirochaetaceae bacterium]